MKKLISAIGSVCIGLSLHAQADVIMTRPANNPEGKTLTMEETILSRELYPENERYFWADGAGHELRRIDANGQEAVIDINGRTPEKVLGTFRTAEDKIYRTDKGFENITESPHVEGKEPMYAYTLGNNLFICRSSDRIDTLTSAESPDIVSGQTVSRNEFGIEGGIFWAPDAGRLAYFTKDESKVGTFPLLDITTRTGSLKSIRYPMAGMDSERVSLHIYDLADGQTCDVENTIAKDAGWDNPEEAYITNVCWSPDGSHIFAQILDRSQKHCKLCMFDNEGKLVRTILSEDNDKYVEPLDPVRFIKGKDNLFVYRTANRDGYRSLYLCDTEGNIRRITEVAADVSYIGNNGEYIYYTSAEISPVENHLFRIRMKNLDKGVSKTKFGKPERLTHEEGWHNILLSPDGLYFIDNYSSLTVPRVINLCKGNGSIVRNLLTAKDPTTEYAYTEIRLGTIKSADGQYDNHYRMILPKDFDPSRKYPLILYVYGGPHSQMVRNTFMAELRRWEMYMAQRGYIVYVQDNRGTQNQGLAYEQAIHGQCGQAEMADQMEGMKMLMSLPYVDKERIGVHGWSYGGFMTISLMTNYPEVFKVGVAGGPVIDWKWYEVMYGERYMGHPDANPEGYRKVSLINKAKDLKGKLLICQGAIDPVVVWEHSLSFVRECVVNNVQLDYFPYPCHEHNVRGKDRVHLMDKVSMYFEDYL